MRQLSDKLPAITGLLKSRRGDELVEAAFVLPVVILVVVLTLRLFAFYLEIIKTQVDSHSKAVEMWGSYEGGGVRRYSDQTSVVLISGGILKSSIKKDVITETYLINFDMVLRTGELLDAE